MARAFTDVTELHLAAEHMAGRAAGAVEPAREFVAAALDDIADRMRGEVPVASGETRDSVEVRLDHDGLGGSVGPTNVDDRGRPVGFFIEHGTGRQAPDPFVLRTSVWAEGEIPGRAEALLRGLVE